MQRRWMVLFAVAACRSNASPSTGSAAPSVSSVSSARPGTISGERPSSSVPPPAVTPAASVATDWCVDGLSALDEDVCYVLPPIETGPPLRLLVYLHGIVPPVPDSPQKHTVEGAVVRASVRAGAAALVPRGRRGLGPTQARDWWAWPTTPSAIAALAPSMVARWAEGKKKLETIIGRPFERTYLAGSSNGAYFVAALALRGDLPSSVFPVDGFGAISGGAAGAGPLSGVAPRPFYVGYGTYDEETKARVPSLVAALKSAHWPVLAAEHPLGHGANEAYLDEAFAFWDAQDGRVPSAETLPQ
jgi:predicted esterase